MLLEAPSIIFDLGGEVHCGGRHLVALLNDGTIRVTGDNNSGQLGIGTNDDIRSVADPLLTGVVDIEAGEVNTFVFKDDGSILGAGNNSYKQLLSGGVLSSYNTFQSVANTEVKDITANKLSSNFAMTMADESLKFIGYNYHGRFGNATTANSQELVSTYFNVEGKVVADVSLGCHTMVSYSDGTIMAAGYNGSGMLGDGTNGRRLSPVYVIGYDTPQ